MTPPPTLWSRHNRACLATGCALATLLGGAARAGEPGAAPAAPTPSGTDASATAAVSEVVVTGFRGGSRTVLDSPTPIDVVAPAQLIETGKVGLKEILNTVVPSFNLPGVNGGGTSWTVRAYTVRGLNGDQALFLVNGKRRHTTALINNLARVGNGGVPVDLDLIPPSAIARIEVLRDGAAAQYGSDAIAGVINIILKDAARDGELSTSLGADYAGDGFTYHVTADAGFHLPHNGALHLSIDTKANDQASRSQPTSVTLYGKPLAPFGSDPRDLTADRYAFGHSYGPGVDRVTSGAYDLTQPVNDALTVYAFGTVSGRSTRKNTGSFLPNNKNSLADVYPDGFNALRKIRELDFQVTEGVKSQVFGFDLDASTSYAHDDAYLAGDNTLNASLGPTSPRDFHLSTQIFEQITNNLDLVRAFSVGFAQPLTVAFGAEQRYEHFVIAAGDPASYAVGSYIIPTGQYAGQPPNPGLASYSGTAPADAGTATRNNIAGYIDLSTEPVKNWYVGVAGRYEHYTTGVGDTASGKFTTRYEFLPGYAVRGTISNGFRAPSLAQTIFSSSTITGVVCPSSGQIRGAPCVPGSSVTYPTKFLPAGSAAAQALGATPLKPETSMNYSMGLTAQPVSHLRLSVDAFLIDIDDRIVATGLLNLTATNLASSPALAALLPRFPNGFIAQYFTNAVATRTQGIDVVADYSRELGAFGRLDLSAAYTVNNTTIRGFKPTPVQLQGFGFVLFDRQKQADLTKAVPRDKIILSEDWTLGRWRASARETRYGGWLEVNSAIDPTLDRRFGAKWIADLEIAYEFTSRTELALGADNLFDTYPDRIGIVDKQTGIGQYGNFSPFGITGGFYYARVTHRF